MGCGGGWRRREGGQRQETQGCWHVLFFHYVISIPMRWALIFDEPSAQHPPLSPSHPIPSRPPLSSPSFYFSSRLSSPTYSSRARLLLCTREHLPFLLEPLHLCQSSRGGLDSGGWGCVCVGGGELLSVSLSIFAFCGLSRDFTLCVHKFAA